jgi:hypothetical protein
VHKPKLTKKTKASLEANGDIDNASGLHIPTSNAIQVEESFEGMVEVVDTPPAN